MPLACRNVLGLDAVRGYRRTMQGDTTTRALRQRMVLALARANRGRDQTSAIALRSTLGVLAGAEAASGRGREGTGPELSDLEVAGIVAAEADRRERAAQRYDEAGDPRRARRMQAEAEVLRDLLDD